jgi:hypothetical protein
MHKGDTWMAVISGVGGGVYKYATMLQIEPSFKVKLIESALVAIICGACGVIGKEITSWVIKKWFKK